MCLQPVIIYNKSLSDFVRVPCGKCDVCKINKVNSNIPLLSAYINKFSYAYFVTLTYDNFHLPVIPVGGNIVCRYTGTGDWPFQFLYEIPDLVWPAGVSYASPSNCSDLSNFVAVLHYPDIQKFIKRLRKNGKFKFRYFALAEYGSLSRRPHYHLLFLSDSDIGRELQASIVKNWPMCDWSKLPSDEWFKYASNGVSGYLSSYVNSSSCCDGVLSSKWFRQKTFRSKDVDFSVNAEISEIFKNLFYPRTAGWPFYQEGKRTFVRSFQSKVNNLSSSLIPSRILSTYICKPKEACKLSFVPFRCRCHSVLRAYFKGSKELVTSSDYLFVLAYRRYCKMFNLQADNYHTADNYIFWVYRLLSAYASEQLRLEMELFPKLGMKEYILLKNNTYLGDTYKRNKLIYRLTGYDDNFYTEYDYDFSKYFNMRNNVMLRSYQYKLLPKHLNDLHK